MRPSNPSHSPIRKQLVKKIVSYYDVLDERHESEHKRGSKSPKRRKNSEEKNPRVATIHRKRYEGEQHEYKDRNMRFKKMVTLKDLMKTELEKANCDGSLDRSVGDLKKSFAGYPSFMKEKNHKLKNPLLLKKDTVEVDVEPYSKEILELLESKVMDAETKELTEPSEVSSDFEEEIKTISNHKNSTGSVGESSKAKLYHLEIGKNYIHHSKSEFEDYDYHQRKSKEIRRL